MDRSAVITLIAELYAQDSVGVYKPLTPNRRTTRAAFAEVTSVTLNEMINAAQLGFKPALRFRVFEYDYHGEKYVEYNSNIYAIYRTYRDKNEILDLYAELKISGEIASEPEPEPTPEPTPEEPEEA